MDRCSSRLRADFADLESIRIHIIKPWCVIANIEERTIVDIRLSTHEEALVTKTVDLLGEKTSFPAYCSTRIKGFSTHPNHSTGIWKILERSEATRNEETVLTMHALNLLFSPES